MKRLKDAAQGVGRFFEQVEALEEKLGPVVFQLPGRFKPDRERLAAFIAALPAGHRYAFEFRDPAWFLTEIFEALAKRDVALLPVRVRRSGSAARGHRRLRLHPPARPRGRLPGLVQRRGAAHLGQAHPRLVRQRPRRTATSTTTTVASPQERAAPQGACGADSAVNQRTRCWPSRSAPTCEGHGRSRPRVGKSRSNSQPILEEIRAQPGPHAFAVLLDQCLAIPKRPGPSRK